MQAISSLEVLHLSITLLNMLEMTLIVHGRVQGVGYRYSILNHIDDNQVFVRGYVSNQPNGTVKIVAQGDLEALKDVKRFALNGSSRSLVREVEEVYAEIKDYTFDDFSIRY